VSLVEDRKDRRSLVSIGGPTGKDGTSREIYQAQVGGAEVEQWRRNSKQVKHLHTMEGCAVFLGGSATV